MYVTDQKTRSRQYRDTLEVSKGTVFISGVSGSGLLTKSLDLLRNKLVDGNKVQILLMDPLFAEANKRLIPFNKNVVDDIKKSLSVLESLPQDNLQVRLYNHFMPIVVTGNLTDELTGNMVYEVIDYLPDSPSPICEASAIHSPHTFKTIRNKFYFYWANARSIQFS